MSRSGYGEGDGEPSDYLYFGAVASAMRGKRGQKMFRALVEALDAMPDKALIRNELETSTGAVCALGALAKHGGIVLPHGLDPDDAEAVANRFDIAESLAREVVYRNDEDGPYKETPEQRWTRMRAWAVSKIAEAAR